MKHVDAILDVLVETRKRGRGAVTFIRVQSADSLSDALATLLRQREWKWHEIDAADCDDGHQLLERAKGLTVDPNDVWLVYNLPDSRGADGDPRFYQSMAKDLNLIEVVGGARIVFLVGVPQMQAISRLAPQLWQRKRAFSAWPEKEEVEQRAVKVDVSAGPGQSGGTDLVEGGTGDALVAALTGQLKASTSKHEKSRLFQKLALVLAGLERVEAARTAATKAARGFKDEGDMRSLAQCYELLGSLAEKRGNVDVARDWIGFALDSWTAVGDELRTSECHAKHGHLSYVLGDREQAAQQFQLAIEIDEALDHKNKVSAGLRRLGLMAEEEQKYKLADKLYNDAADICRELEDDIGLSRSLHSLGRLHERMGSYVEAFNFHRQSLELKEGLGDRLGMATSYHHLGNTYFFTREYEQAKACYGQALEIEDEVGDHQGRASTLQQLGEVSMAEYRWGDALWYFMAAHHLWRQLGSPQVHAVQVHIARASEMLDEATVAQVKADVKEKLSEYTAR